ncbi:phosphoribosylglycinamide formyltransferase [Corynebacterium glaucum]|uniref:phosphoribosylglycinamide formyltransferase n=1 Tax=Corynebacterium glaucum TaxID=187491 RepID=UPI0025B52D56|nr:phosphoribosylglycinamide formyltransferase [Corynebacterium glaucum]WJZ07226.1 Phosphoribosylglycinamide formyltransferase [Corynebacterium glaucum]
MTTLITVLVSGSGTLLQAILDNQSEAYRVALVVADKPCPALERAERVGVPTRVVALGADRGAWDEKLAQAVAAGNPDLVVSAGFMRILGQAFLDRFQGKTVNTHPSLLPAFPGADAVGDALAYGVKVTGCTVHFVDAGVDTGEIIAQRAIRVEDGDTKDTLHERIKQAEREQIVGLLASARLDNGKVTF